MDSTQKSLRDADIFLNLTFGVYLLWTSGLIIRRDKSRMDVSALWKTFQYIAFLVGAILLIVGIVQMTKRFRGQDSAKLF